ncbi:hypothetical protein ACFRFU_45155 [Streptomyces sp. NPDC056704]|uniref:hypothetical protein n=1 Tax=Streptomyces sp. NPDC056704 TaxID=3345917 RepID=UPI0036CDCFE0
MSDNYLAVNTKKGRTGPIEGPQGGYEGNAKTEVKEIFNRSAARLSGNLADSEVDSVSRSVKAEPVRMVRRCARMPEVLEDHAIIPSALVGPTQLIPKSY